jgi:Zn-dependent protease
MHALSAYWRGDDTAAMMGRVSLNPFRHIDPIGLIAFFLIGLGWAKPVPINPNRMKNIRWDPVITALSGPASNLFLCVIFALILRLFWEPITHLDRTLSEALITFLVIGAQLNAALAFFNLIPVPPLDGSHILVAILPVSALEKFERFSRYGLLIILFIMFFGGGLKYVIGIPMTALLHLLWGNELSAEIFRILKMF